MAWGMRARLIVVPVAVALAAAALAAPLILAQLDIPREQMVVPGALDWQTTLFSASLLAPLGYIALVLLLLRPALAGLRRGWRWAYLIGTFIVQIGVGFGALAANIGSDPDFLAGSVTDTAVAPDRMHTAYVVTGGVMCGYDVYLAERGARTMSPVGSASLRCDEQSTGRVRWIDGATVELRDDRGVVSTITVPPPPR